MQSQDGEVTGFTDSCGIPKAAVCQALCGATNLVCKGEKLDPLSSLSLKLFLFDCQDNILLLFGVYKRAQDYEYSLTGRLSENVPLYPHI